MSALEIVLVSVLGSIAVFAALGILVMHALQENKAANLNFLNLQSEKGKTVLFGDSLMDFYPVQEFFPTRHIYNRGIANDTTKDLLARLENVTDLAPSKLFLLIGTNDLGCLVKPQKILANTEKIVEAVRLSSPGVKIYILSQFPVLRTATFFSVFSCNFRTNKKLRALSAMQKEFCLQNGCTFIDVWPVLSDKKNRLKREYTIEGLHLTIKGYSAVSEVLRPYIFE